MKTDIRTMIVPMLLMFALGSVGLAGAEDLLDPGTTNVSFPGPGNVTLKGYLVVPSGSGPFPAVVMIHEWWGLNRDVTKLADALSKQGYVVLAADTFRGRVAKTPAEAIKQTSETPREQIAADLDATLAFLRSYPQVDGQRVASIGFCFGGTQSMYMGTRNPELAAVVIFYGSGPIQDAAQLGRMREAGPVLGIYGESDGNIPVEQVRGFEKALTARNVENTITIYPGVGHAFVKSNTYQDGAAAQKAWTQMLEFLNRTLKRIG